VPLKLTLFTVYIFLHYHSTFALEMLNDTVCPLRSTNGIMYDKCEHICCLKQLCVLYCSGSEVDVVHCVVDRNLITGQNEQSTVVAVQNVILACSLQYDSACCFLLAHK